MRAFTMTHISLKKMNVRRSLILQTYISQAQPEASPVASEASKHIAFTGSV
jgi:hypothetical protein